jgi:uncharacterized membrane protein
VERSALLVIALALVAANLPFVSERIFFVFTAKEGHKQFFWRLAELIVLYFVVGGAAWLLEAKLGAVHKQGWEFYAITACLFLVFAYPGLVVRYFWKSRK